MKTTIYAFAIVAFMATSCKKDYTCNCRDAKGNITEVTKIHDKKSSAKTSCEARKSAPEYCKIE